MPAKLSYKKRLKNIKAKSMLSTACYRHLFRLWKPCGKLFDNWGKPCKTFGALDRLTVVDGYTTTKVLRSIDNDNALSFRFLLWVDFQSVFKILYVFEFIDLFWSWVEYPTCIILTHGAGITISHSLGRWRSAPPQAGLGVGHGGVWRYLYMPKHTEGENWLCNNKVYITHPCMGTRI